IYLLDFLRRFPAAADPAQGQGDERQKMFEAATFHGYWEFYWFFDFWVFSKYTWKNPGNARQKTVLLTVKVIDYL
ncbi:MAG: hypothetical protein R6V72_15230, partial [Cyclobacterium sp.]|uniref:hypothetical protein n=1 Tax=Cyclobacterium sp. TaxID=1966343 RepID=UPI003970F704